MPYYQKHSSTTYNQFLIDLAAFVAANGWTVDFDGVYNTNYRRLHCHQGDMHVDLCTGPGPVYMYRCTGYNGAAAPSVQPGAGSTSGTGFYLMNSYWFVSTVGAVWIGLDNGSTYAWGGIWSQITKIGAWSGGFGSHTPSAAQLFSEGCGSVSYCNQIYANNSWGTPGGAGALSGSAGLSDLAVKQPVLCNAGIVPFPILITSYYAADITKRVPLGFAPGLFRTNGGDIYSPGDEISIGADTYLILPRYYGSVGNGQYGDYLFKLGA